MKRITTLAATTAVALSLATSVSAMTDSQMVSQLTGGLYSALSSAGFDTAHIDKLTLNEISIISLTLGSGSMGDGEGQKIELILDRASKR